MKENCAPRVFFLPPAKNLHVNQADGRGSAPGRCNGVPFLGRVRRHGRRGCGHRQPVHPQVPAQLEVLPQLPPRVELGLVPAVQVAGMRHPNRDVPQRRGRPVVDPRVQPLPDLPQAGDPQVPVLLTQDRGKPAHRQTLPTCGGPAAEVSYRPGTKSIVMKAMEQMFWFC